MKKIMVSAAVAALLCSCAGDPHQFTLQGQIEGAEGQLYVMNNHGEAIDSAKVEHGAFKFEGTVEKAGLYYLTNSSNPMQITMAEVFFLEPGALKVVKVEDNYRIAGTKANDNYNVLNAAASKIQKEMQAEGTTEERQEELVKEIDRLKTQSIEENLDNILGVALFQEAASELPAEEALAQIEKFTPEMQQSEMLQAIKEHIIKTMKTAVGQPYLDLTQADKDGNAISLKSVVETEGNKYVLLDFWASWCGPCRGEIPHLVASYNSFHAKGFEIYGVSLDENKDAWQSIIEKKQMTWINVSDLKAWQNEGAQLYGVQGIPANFLIECETGKIITKNLRGAELIEKLEELFK